MSYIPGLLLLLLPAQALIHYTMPWLSCSCCCCYHESNTELQPTCGAVQLPTEEQPAELLRLQAGVALVRWQEVILHCVRGPQQRALL